jgi:GMP synthase (glutamine-hydrolysing)
MRVHIVMHESFEAPGAIEQWIKDNNCEVSYTKLYKGDAFPENLDFDYLIVMGGPQSPDTTTAECSYFEVQKEIAFIKNAIEQDKYLLGVCLGSQLIGEALGAKFDHSPNREIGVYNLTLTEDGKQDPIIGTFPEIFPVGHWHGDMPGLTPESRILATSEGCPRQIVRYTDRIYGFQCHFEFNKEAIEGMIENSTHELEAYKDLPYIETAEKLKSNDYTPINSLLFKFLDYMKSKFESTK